MLFLLSPAKSLVMDGTVATQQHSIASFLDQSQTLVETLRDVSVDGLASLMNISDALAQENHERYVQWEQPVAPDEATRQALLAFDGDVYKGMEEVGLFDESDYAYSQQVLRILSGLYGVLRPLDLIKAYRLEMGTKLTVGEHKNLYQFWGSALTAQVTADLEASSGEPVVVNLASQEYFKAIKRKELAASVISPRFLDAKEGAEFKVISFFAKRARGAMAAWAIKNRIENPADLLAFDALGYHYSPKHSEDATPTFVRTYE